MPDRERKAKKVVGKGKGKSKAKKESSDESETSLDNADDDGEEILDCIEVEI